MQQSKCQQSQSSQNTRSEVATALHKSYEVQVNYAKDQLATHAFDTVEKATTLLENVLGLPGFSDFWVKLHRPEAPSFDLSGKLKLGKIKIEINLISANKHWELDLGTIDLPGSLKAVVSTSLSTVQGAMSLGGELLSCSNWHLPGEAVKCIGNKIVDLFAQLKKVASTALATVEGAMSLGQELQSCSNWHLPGEAVKCFAGKTIEKVEELNFPGDSAVQQVQKMITVGRDLNCANWHVNGGLVTCLGTKIIDKVPPLKATVNVGHELSACSQQTGDALMQCLGTIIIENTPPFSFLSHLGDLLSEFLEARRFALLSRLWAHTHTQVPEPLRVPKPLGLCRASRRWRARWPSRS